jgi:uncharacterized protein
MSIEITHGLISADSHVVLDRDAFTSRMAQERWGDRIPHVVEVEARGRLVERWSVNGETPRGGMARGVCNCPAVMDDPLNNTYPQRWEEVPPDAYDPAQRLRALDRDGVDAEVLFPNDPAQGSFHSYGDPAFELACVQAHNDALAAFRAASERFIPLTVLPYLSDMPTLTAEVVRAARLGHRGIVMLAEPSLTSPKFKHLSDPYWDPLWATCQELELPVHFHASGGVGQKLSMPQWDGYAHDVFHSAFTIPTGHWPAQFIPNLIFSGIAGRFPNLKWVFAETGIGSVNYVLECCDHEWEQRHLWTAGITERPSETVRRQMYVNFWYEAAGIKLRHQLGVSNIMWESDYPHTASTYPDSWKYVERTLAGVPNEERVQLLYANALRVYRLN